MSTPDLSQLLASPSAPRCPACEYVFDYSTFPEDFYRICEVCGHIFGRDDNGMPRYLTRSELEAMRNDPRRASGIARQQQIVEPLWG